MNVLSDGSGSNIHYSIAQPDQLRILTCCFSMYKMLYLLLHHLVMFDETTLLEELASCFYAFLKRSAWPWAEFGNLVSNMLSGASDCVLYSKH